MVVFCPASGDTHWLDAATALLLKHPGENADDIAAALAVEPDPDFQAWYAATLARLAQLGLIAGPVA
jgi:PqqD family protein of HPr-rel-A system